MSTLKEEKHKLDKEILAEEKNIHEIEVKSKECDKKECECNNKSHYQEAQKESKAIHKAERKLEVEEFEEKRLERELKKECK